MGTGNVGTGFSPFRTGLKPGPTFFGAAYSNSPQSIVVGTFDFAKRLVSISLGV